eukprot:366415-Chlamydomonas_euryale.AAC.14
MPISGSTIALTLSQAHQPQVDPTALETRGGFGLAFNGLGRGAPSWLPVYRLNAGVPKLGRHHANKIGALRQGSFSGPAAAVRAAARRQLFRPR